VSIRIRNPALATVADGVRALVKAGTVAHRIDPASHRILNEQVPRVGRLAKAMDTSRRITKAIERFLRAHADELHPGCDPAVAAIVVETTVEASELRACSAAHALARRRSNSATDSASLAGTSPARDGRWPAGRDVRPAPCATICGSYLTQRWESPITKSSCKANKTNKCNLGSYLFDSLTGG
jgi:hypothetical protein